ncbi:hypothetical protein [Spiroplasma endosymbiont of Labia minor]|uniref:oxidoreductase n=1 Tax=Spiroplasma endosymbiont of Labia minor TaxID=3066305 RepID=UPI0030D196A0
MKLTDELILIKDKPARNRIVMPPMDTLMASDGFANDFHIQHYGARAYGGVGTIIVESTAVSKEGRIRENDLGIWKDEHIENLTKVAKIIKKGGAIAGIQLNHAGSKADLDTETIGLTKYFDYMNQDKLKIASIQDLKIIKDKFIAAAFRAKQANFDFVEIHAAHGYLLSELISPKLNDVIVSDDILVRTQLIIDIIDEINEKVKIPVGIRVSFTDHTPGGMELTAYKPFVKTLENKLIYFHVSSGETLARVRMSDIIADLGHKLFRLPIATEVKKWTKTPLITVGNFGSLDDVNKAMNANIDAVAMGRVLIYNPNHVVNNLLTVDELDKTKYHWNDNLWFSYQHYKAIITKK